MKAALFRRVQFALDSFRVHRRSRTRSCTRMPADNRCAGRRQCELRWRFQKRRDVLIYDNDHNFPDFASSNLGSKGWPEMVGENRLLSCEGNSPVQEGTFPSSVRRKTNSKHLQTSSPSAPRSLSQRRMLCTVYQFLRRSRPRSRPEVRSIWVDSCLCQRKYDQAAPGERRDAVGADMGAAFAWRRSTPSACPEAQA